MLKNNIVHTLSITSNPTENEKGDWGLIIEHKKSI
jgi:hypothetical protein